MENSSFFHGNQPATEGFVEGIGGRTSFRKREDSVFYSVLFHFLLDDSHDIFS